MAEIISGGTAKKSAGVKKNKKLSTRVDLTPMVDLGFLLITFFVFTTRITEPTALKLSFPKDTEPTPIKASGALTLLLAKDNIVFYYEGQLLADGSNMHETTFRGLREIIINKQGTPSAVNLMVIIKPQSLSVYRNAVDALDEMTINNVKSYAMLDITTQEEKFIEERYLKSAGNN